MGKCGGDPAATSERVGYGKARERHEDRAQRHGKDRRSGTGTGTHAGKGKPLRQGHKMRTTERVFRARVRARARLSFPSFPSSQLIALNGGGIP